MKARHLKLALAVGLAVFTGGLAYTLATADLIASAPSIGSTEGAAPQGTSAPAADSGWQPSPNAVPKPTPFNPDAGLSDAQRMEIVAAAHAYNDEYLQNFVRTGQDPRSLPRLDVPAYAASPPSLGDAVAESTLIGTGRVISVNFALNPSGGLPLATSSVALDSVVKGEPVATLTVLQLGGPVAQETGGALAQLNNDELLLPGDDVVLFLERDSLGRWRPLPGAGIIFIESGVAVPEASNAFGTSLKGQTKAAAVAVIADLARGQSAAP